MTIKSSPPQTSPHWIMLWWLTINPIIETHSFIQPAIKSQSWQATFYNSFYFLISNFWNKCAAYIFISFQMTKTQFFIRFLLLLQECYFFLLALIESKRDISSSRQYLKYYCLCRQAHCLFFKTTPETWDFTRQSDGMSAVK